ncbi:MAG: serine/threonine protein kinase [Gemmatimonadaceae bacterium]|nr:serine/threonine protein kinase [Gemmatimonadaceae bacterium]
MTNDLTALSQSLGERYLIVRELGRGGMGTVYLARDRRLDRPVALKVLPAEYAADPDLRERFLRETRMAAGFSHPNIVPVFAIEDTEDVLAFAMGFVEGESLASRVTVNGPMQQRDAVRLLQDVGYALAYAHGRGVVHRDIKPDNIMIERATGRALVMDFGIARAITPVSDKPGLTRVGEVVGTPEYMSPEQAAGDAVDGRADLYSLGLVAWFAMAGRTAVTGESTQRILVKQLTEAIPSLSSVRADLPASLAEVVDTCCNKEADDRYATAEALVEALEATQLATPDVPVAVRLLAPDLTAVAMRTLAAILMIAYGMYGMRYFGNGNVFSLGLIASAMAWVSGMAAAQEVRRLRKNGYTVSELQRLLGVVQAERDDERGRRKADPLLVARRRKRVLIAGALLLAQGAVLINMVRGATSSGEAALKSPVAIVTFFGALLGAAIATTVLISSPFRRRLGEVVFRRIWLGANGARLLALLGGRERNAAAGSADAPTRPTDSSRATAPGARGKTAAGIANSSPTLTSLAADVDLLRTRVDALETKR